MTTIAGYRASRDRNGVLTIYDVPIFLECQRGDFEATEEWIQQAVLNAKQAESDGYMPPLHIRHHEMGAEVRAAGYFRITRAEPSSFKGQKRLTIFADLVITDPGAQSEVLSQRLPYRSVEIYDIQKPEINSLALLDHEAPYLQLPMLMVDDVSEHPAGPQSSVAYATLASPWLADDRDARSPLVACFSRGASRFLITEDSEHMSTTTPKAKPAASKSAGKSAPKSKPVLFMEGEDKKDEEGDGENMEAGEGMDVGAIVKAIEDGSISVADMEAITAAIQSRLGASEPEEAEEPAEVAAPAMAPGGESMKASGVNAQKFAEQAAELALLRAKIEKREKDEQRRADVDATIARFEGKAVGANFRAELEQFHTEHGREAFQAFADALAGKLGDVPTSSGAAMRFSSVGGQLPECVQRYQGEGSEAVRLASTYAREWEQHKGRIRASQDEYVAQMMAARN